MPKSSTFDNDLLKLIFNATPIANIADNAVTSPLGSLYLSLHTADPGVGGTQATNETAYTGYARQAITRSAGGFTITGSSVSPVANIDFPVCTATPGAAITYAALGVAVNGASKILYSGVLTPAITMAAGVAPRIPPTSTITES